MKYVLRALEPVKAFDLPKLDSSTQRRIKKKLDQIRSDPHGYGKPLVGRYRLVYQVREAEHLILIIAIAHREEIYELARERAGR